MSVTKSLLGVSPERRCWLLLYPRTGISTGHAQLIAWVLHKTLGYGIFHTKPLLSMPRWWLGLGAAILLVLKQFHQFWFLLALRGCLQSLSAGRLLCVIARNLIPSSKRCMASLCSSQVVQTQPYTEQWRGSTERSHLLDKCSRWMGPCRGLVVYSKQV